jgi:Asp-tRNA(Asn)/Glu-tRNA(Gln) amidotransferase C subunit
MQTFLNFLTEASNKSKAISHLTHLGGEGHLMGSSQHKQDLSDMEHLHNFMSGKKSEVKSVGVKADGSPSFEMGHVVNPKTGEKQFGVAYKGAARGYAFDQEDVNQKFGHSEGLKSKMGQLLEHGKKIMSPLHGVVQGDFMGSKKDNTIGEEDGEVTHKENLIKYHYPKNSDEAKSLKKAKISIALHTRIDKEQPEYNIDQSKFYHSPDVHMFNNKLKQSGVKYKEDEQEQFQKHFNKAKETFSKINNLDDLVEGHTDHLQTYINKTVREGSGPSANNYKAHLKSKLQKEVDKVKTPAAKQRKADFMNHMVEDVELNKEHFNHLFNGHKELDKAKTVMLRALEHGSQNQKQTIHGNKASPEGFVVGYKSGSVKKVVDRTKEGFSGLNLNK